MNHGKHRSVKSNWMSLLGMLGAVLLLAACGGGGGSGGSSGGSGGSGVSTATLAGTWMTGCVDSDGTGTVYIIATTTYTAGGSYGSTVDFYSDVICATSTGMQKVDIGTYSLGNDITTTSGLGAREIDYLYDWTLYQNGSVVNGGTNATRYDIVRIDGNWLYGSNVAATTPASRPNQLDMTVHATRQ